MANKDTLLTLEDAVGEVLSTLTGLDLSYDPSLDRFQSITRFLNRALRAVALEREWSYYSTTEDVGSVVDGMESVELGSLIRPRMINDDAVRFVDSEGTPLTWAYFIPRDALHKYRYREGLWVSATRSTLYFSRPLHPAVAGMRILMPAMREPKMFRLPKEGGEITSRILNQPIDFDYPDLVVAKAAQYMAETDPVMQPRVQTLEAKYKDLMYQLVERDERATDSPYQNDFMIPISSGIDGPSYSPWSHGHPHSDERWR